MQGYFFVFETEDKAKVFVQRVAHYLKDVALFRDGAEVKVFDGHAKSQESEIVRLAKSSSAMRAVTVEISFASPDDTKAP